MNYQRIVEDDGICWPCPELGHSGTPRIFLDRFATPDGRARFHPVEHRPAAEEPDRDFPMYLTTGRVMAHYQSGNQTRRVAALHKAQPEAFVEIHPAIARGFGIAESDAVRLTTRRGSAVMRARLTPTIRMDTVFAPFHWGGHQCANLLTNPALDPVSKMPEFKVCAVRIEKATPASHADYRSK
jgi:assimilatory nitrate reductase catalytic subunit